MGLSQKNKISLKNKRILAFSPVAVVAFMMLQVGSTAPAEASVLDFIFGTSSKKEVSKSTENVQNMAVLGQGDFSSETMYVTDFVKGVFNDELSALDVDHGSTRDSNGGSGETETSVNTAVYTVKKGDTIQSIAAYFDISVDTIVSFNKLDDDKVSVGDVLEIPPVNGILYEVKNSGTIEDVAKKYSIDADDISLFNGIISDQPLQKGDEIFLPGVKPEKKEVKKEDKKTTTKDKKTVATKAAPKVISSSLLKSSNYSGLPKYEGYYIHPAPGAVRTQKLHGHNGVDLAAPVGTNLRASAAGTVVTAKTSGWNFGLGKYVVISHPNGTQTVYGHMSRIDVVVGQSVSQGESIGKMGSTGNSTGSHVHFEIRGAYNPFAW